MSKIINKNSVDLLAFLDGLKNEKSLIKKCFILGLIIISSIYLFSDRLYTSQALIAPIDDFEKNAVSSVLASQLGLSNDVNIDPQTIFHSEALKKELIYKNREFLNRPKVNNLIGFWEMDSLKWYNPLDWLQALLNKIKSKNNLNDKIKLRSIENSTIKKLNKRISYSQDFYTNEIIISTTMEDRLLAQEINNDIINYINRFITTSKNKNAASQAFFLNKRMSEVKDSLKSTEDELERFLQNNKSYRESPSLQKIHMRLLRKIEIDTQIIIQLTTQLEVSKVEELSEMSNFVIVDYSSFPAKKVYPKALKLLIFLIIIITIIITSIVIYKDIKKEKIS